MEAKKEDLVAVFTDGGSRGNPGPAAIGVYIVKNNDIVLAQIAKNIGRATNNVAEYSAIIEGFKWIFENKKFFSSKARIEFFLDSQLAVRQLLGIYKVKNPLIRELVFTIRQHEIELGLKIAYNHIPREKNIQADKLVNIALDNKATSSLQ